MSNIKQQVIDILNEILETELAGVVRYTHYSLMIFGHNRIPIVKWLKEQANESLIHANEAGEMITHYGGHPSLAIGPLLETENHNIDDILTESQDHEAQSLNLYKKLLQLTEDNIDYILIREYAVQKITEEESHLGEVDKMLRKEGSLS
ncbi:ferritin-like domain-containing protein [Rickettsiales bacterium]|nr:ferritin-like domain-containing protein [Rickettsiales bacterium]MDB2550517.1 ferritin-like domain-containing protein [Rickettsiales bacterium]